MLFPVKFTQGFKRMGREKRANRVRTDVVGEQVKRMLQETDQKIILMVRG